MEVNLMKPVESTQFDDERNCIICLMPLEESLSAALSCKHNLFHFDCILQWAKVSAKCPYCKQKLVSILFAGKENRLPRGPAVAATVADDEDDYDDDDANDDTGADYCAVCAEECRRHSRESPSLFCRCGECVHMSCIGRSAEDRSRWKCAECIRRRAPQRSRAEWSALLSPPSRPSFSSTRSRGAIISASVDPPVASRDMLDEAIQMQAKSLRKATKSTTTTPAISSDHYSVAEHILRARRASASADGSGIIDGEAAVSVRCSSGAVRSVIAASRMDKLAAVPSTEKASDTREDSSRAQGSNSSGIDRRPGEGAAEWVPSSSSSSSSFSSSSSPSFNDSLTEMESQSWADFAAARGRSQDRRELQSSPHEAAGYNRRPPSNITSISKILQAASNTGTSSTKVSGAVSTLYKTTTATPNSKSANIDAVGSTFKRQRAGNSLSSSLLSRAASELEQLRSAKKAKTAEQTTEKVYSHPRSSHYGTPYTSSSSLNSHFSSDNPDHASTSSIIHSRSSGADSSSYDGTVKGGSGNIVVDRDRPVGLMTHNHTPISHSTERPSSATSTANKSSRSSAVPSSGLKYEGRIVAPVNSIYNLMDKVLAARSSKALPSSQATMPSIHASPSRSHAEGRGACQAASVAASTDETTDSAVAPMDRGRAVSSSTNREAVGISATMTTTSRVRSEQAAASFLRRLRSAVASGPEAMSAIVPEIASLSMSADVIFIRSLLEGVGPPPDSSDSTGRRSGDSRGEDDDEGACSATISDKNDDTMRGSRGSGHDRMSCDKKQACHHPSNHHEGTTRATEDSGNISSPFLALLCVFLLPLPSSSQGGEAATVAFTTNNVDRLRLSSHSQLVPAHRPPRFLSARDREVVLRTLHSLPVNRLGHKQPGSIQPDRPGRSKSAHRGGCREDEDPTGIERLRTALSFCVTVSERHPESNHHGNVPAVAQRLQREWRKEARHNVATSKYK